MVETKLRHQEESVQVMRRYNDFDWLHTVLKCEYHSCVIPPIPPKTYQGKWAGDDSEFIKERKAGLERFL